MEQPKREMEGTRRCNRPSAEKDALEEMTSVGHAHASLIAR